MTSLLLITIMITPSFPEIHLEDLGIFNWNWVAILKMPNGNYLVQGKYDNKLIVLGQDGAVLAQPDHDRNLVNEPVVLGFRNGEILVANKNGSVVGFDYRAEPTGTQYPKLKPVPMPRESYYNPAGDTFTIHTPFNVTVVGLREERWVALRTHSAAGETPEGLPKVYVNLCNDLTFEKPRSHTGDDQYEVRVVNGNGEVINILTNVMAPVPPDHRHFVTVAFRTRGHYVLQRTLWRRTEGFNMEPVTNWLDVFTLAGEPKKANIEIPTALFMQGVRYSDQLYLLDRDTLVVKPIENYIAQWL